MLQDCGSILWTVDRLKIQCNPDTIQMDRSQMLQIGPGLAQIAAGLEPTQNGAQNPGNAGTVFCNPGDCGGLGSLAPCEPGTTARIEDRMQMQGNRFRTATKTSGQQS